LLVARPKHDSHAARADLFDDAVMPQYLTNRERGDRHSPDTRPAICKGQQLEVSIISTLESTASLRAGGPG
jgi:hypothetical protein